MTVNATTLAPARTARRSPARRFATLVATEATVWLRDGMTAAASLIFPVAFLVGVPLVNASMQEPLGADAGHLAGVTGVQLFVPAVLAMAMASPAVLALPTAFASFREKGVLRRMSATPLRPQSLLGAHVLINAAATLVAAGLALVAAHHVFGLVAPRQLGVVVGSYTLGLVAMFALGMLLAAVLRRTSQASGIGMLLYFASLVAAGFMTPGSMPEAMADVARFTPLGAVSQALEIGWFQGGFPLVQVVVLAAWTAVLVPLSARLFRWT